VARAERRRRLDSGSRRRAAEASSAEQSRRVQRRAIAGLWWSAVAILLLYTGLALERKITWYLAVDQFGYLTFAHDLLAGHVFHHWPPMDAFARNLVRTDVLAQTYVYDHGRLFSRYAPGFPMILAAWIGVFGDDGAHLLNPTLYLSLTGLLIAFERRLFHSHWRALAGVCLFLLFPTLANLWALTLTRDLSGHLTAFAALFLLLPWRARRLDARRAALAGLGLGFAATIRPDGVLYLIPATSLAIVHWRREKTSWRGIGAACASAAVALTIGLAPALAYNWMATGNPLRPTQGMEVERFFSSVPRPTPMVVARADDGDRRVGYPSPGWHGGALSPVQGGALRLAHLSTTLPANLNTLLGAYGWLFLAVAGWGAIVAFIQRPVLFALAVPYSVLAVLFYSCWSRPDGRYLMGVHILLPMLVVEGTLGTLDLVRRLSRLDRGENARLLGGTAAVSLIVGAFLVPEAGRNTALPSLTGLVTVIAAVGAGAAAAWPNRRVVRFVAPAMALALVALSVSRSNAALASRASFQRPQMVSARATLARAVEPGAVIITTEDIGRPAENIEYYSGIAHAVYLTDLYRWRVNVPLAIAYLQHGGFKPYLLGPPDQPAWSDMIKRIEPYLVLERVADIPPARAMDYFVAAPFHRGIRLILYRARWRERKAR
jgi:hypothetical protein